MKLASIEIITEITSHPNADKLELAKVLGYTCIVGKDEFKAGDAVVLIQPDTLLPDAPWADFFKKRGNRVKAMKLRSVWSFGIVMSPYKVFEDIGILKALLIPDRIGQDISEYIGIIKYEAPLPQSQDAKGSMPLGLVKTDEERYQNFLELPFGEDVDVTLKIDGQSATYFCKRIDPNLIGDDYDVDWKVHTGICSRSLELKPECHNNYTAIEKKYDILRKLEAYCLEHSVSLALRLEIFGKGIQSFNNNPHSKLLLDCGAFNIFNLDKNEYEYKGSEHYYIKVCNVIGVPTVPLIEEDAILTRDLIKYYAEDISTLNDQPFEGVVIKHKGGSFKVINLNYDSCK